MSKGLLISKNGDCREIDDAGGIKVIVPRQHDDGHWTETTYEAGGVVDPDGDPMIYYVEGETVDTTDRMHQAGERVRQETFRQVGIRPTYAEFMTKARYRGESDEGFAKRIRIMKGEEE